MGNNKVYLRFSKNSFFEIIDTFEYLTGLQICILLHKDYNKDIVNLDNIRGKMTHRNPFCSLIKENKNGGKGCGGYDVNCRSQKAKEKGKPFLDECPSGVVELIIPLLINKQFVGTIFCGQLRKFKDIKKNILYICKLNTFVTKYSIKEKAKNFLWIDDEKLIQIGNLLFAAINHVTSNMDYNEMKKIIMLKEHPLLSQIIRKLNDLNEPILSASENAKKCGVSLEYFSRLFKKIIGKNYIDYSTEVRLERARQLLKNTDLNIVRIAMEVGYDNHSYFTKRFKQYFGCVPKRFKRH
ncbi:MAG: hypothetical protein A2096_13640 [Spirochaetes bacterium GWF1_41_5]|nr:MAG: hypothetical protein A2096_13640 [Spirochaetes bacterium GWF1_41_5]HBE02620.1 hypothetical protein [Spirochaetia bacterium]